MDPESREMTAKLAIGLALLIALLDFIIPQAPGSEANRFGIAALLAACGLRSRHWRVRAVAVVLVLVLLWQAWLGHQRDLEYRERVRQLRLDVERMRQPVPEGEP